MKSFGDTIKSLRVAKDLSIREAAGLLGVTHLYLDRIEKGFEIPPKEMVKNFAAAYEMDEGALLELWHSSY
jgi:transcriptional regulator with XRE-family HTH domain